MDLRKREKLDKANSAELLDSNIRSSCIGSTESISESVSIKENNKLTIMYWMCMFAFGFLLFDLAIRLQLSCDYESDFLSFSMNRNYDNQGDPVFNDTLARKHLKEISKLGNRPSGSTANEIHAPIYLINYLQKLKSLYTNQENFNLQMSIDEQIGQLNSFNIVIFNNHITSIYDQIKNIVVRIHDVNNNYLDGSTPAVLINCHYDSFFGGIGASDDLASCVVMLETIHSILKNQPISLKFDLIFLFNGAEENVLQASHAFVSQHKFARDVKLFINLEAAGSGGRQMVFQTSEKNPWLINELATVLRQPLGTIIGQEIFSANLIPSDTDFRIFRDFGHVPGIDIAFIANGYVYHTKYDTEDRIPQACLRHTGNNLLRLSLKLANSNNIAIYPEDEKFVHESFLQSQRIVYFDFLGIILVSYTEFLGLIINFCLFLVAISLVLWRSIRNKNHYCWLVFRASINQVFWMLTNLLLGLLLGYLVDKFGSKMSWYAIRYNVVGLYLVPLIWFFFVYYQFNLKLFSQSIPNHILFQCHRDSCMILLSLVTFVLTFLRLLSSYVIGIWLFFIIINLLCWEIMHQINITRFNLNGVHFLSDAICLSIPFTYSFYLLYILYDVFIPILGRSGPTYPDIVISGLTALAFTIPGLILSASIFLTSKSSTKWLAFMLLHFSISYYLFIHCTQFGFPYNQSEVMPRKQRIIISHVTRNIRNALGQTRLSESGMWMVSLDSNKLVPLKMQLQDVIKDSMQEIFCEIRPYCGYPLLYPFAKIIDNSLWLTQRPHQLQPAASIIILSKVTHISGMVNVTMQVSGPSHTSIYLMTPRSMRITSWSLGPDPPQPVKMPSFSNSNYRHYFITYAYGKKPDKPLRLWMMFMPKIDPHNDFPQESPENQIEIALGAHYLTAQTSELETMIHLMPRWVVPTAVASSYEHLIVDFDQNLSYVQ